MQLGPRLSKMAARASGNCRMASTSISASAFLTLVSNFIPEGMSVQLQEREHGMLGTGPFPFEGDEDSDLINAVQANGHAELPTTS